MSNIYKSAGVDVENSNNVIKDIKGVIKETHNDNCIGGLNNFGNYFDISNFNIKDPMLVAGQDGVGTKLLLAIEMGKFDTVGIDLVAMCANDILASFGKPLFFMDYYASSKLENNQFLEVIKSIAVGCKQANMALIGGENAEMPDMYAPGHFDLVGNGVGICSKSDVESKEIMPGNKIIGIKSNGIHSNGFSLVRKLLFKDNNFSLFDKFEELNGEVLGENLLRPTRIYYDDTVKIESIAKINAAVHITGGGYEDNFIRILNGDLGIEINKSKIPVDPIFTFMAEKSNVDINDFYDVFNMGIGYAVVVDEKDVDKILDLSDDYYLIGEITNSSRFELV